VPDPSDRAALLPAAPLSLLLDGRPLFGAWAGAVQDTGLARLGRPYAQGLARLLCEKKWVYLLTASPEAFLCLAVIDGGPVHTGFCGLLDRSSGSLLCDESPLYPPVCARVSDEAARGPFASLLGPGARISFTREGSSIAVRASLGGCKVDLSLDLSCALPPLSACAALSETRFDFTQKTPWLRASGEVSAGGRRLRFDGDPAGLDFTHGHLARRTEWRWAYGMGKAASRRVAFNCSEGFLGPGGLENVLWVEGEGGGPQALGPVAFSFDPKDSKAPWFLRGKGLALEFLPEGARAQDKSALGLLSSRYVQPFGRFRGHVTTASGERLAMACDGVTEDHAAVW
jgi:Protein of unknown function (DUF2804)